MVDKLQGADAPELANKVAKWAGDNTSVSEAVPASLGLAAGSNVIEAVKKDLAPHVSSETSGNSAAAGSLTEFEKGSLLKLINSNPIMLFMKGTPEAPRCGFSRKVVNALVAEGLQFGSFDILTDDIVRQGLKTYSNWPTYPQLYVKGELLGGCDIILEMKENGELKEVSVFFYIRSFMLCSTCCIVFVVFCDSCLFSTLEAGSNISVLIFGTSIIGVRYWRRRVSCQPTRSIVLLKRQEKWLLNLLFMKRRLLRKQLSVLCLINRLKKVQVGVIYSPD